MICPNCQPLIKAIDAYLANANDDLADTLSDEGFAVPDATAKEIDSLGDSVAEILEEQNDYFIAEAEKSEDLKSFKKRLKKIEDEDPIDVSISVLFANEFEEILPDYIKYYIQQTDKALTLSTISQKTTDWMGTWSAELGRLMKLNSHTEIEKILSDGLEAGQGIAEFTRQIRESGIRDTYWKGRRVAVTEVLRAHSVSQQEAFMQSPAVQKKRWKHTGAYRNEPRKNHAKMDGQTVGKASYFRINGIKGGTFYAMYPRDPALPPEESINCHCIAQPIVDPEILGMSLEDRQALQQQAIDEMDDEWEKELNQKNRAKAGIE